MGWFLASGLLQGLPLAAGLGLVAALLCWALSLPKRLQALSEGGGPVLGISTHDNFEFARAKSLGAAMVGFGPVFDTSTKVLTRKPQGVDRLASAVKEFDLPVIAIGGIGEDTLDAVADTGVAMIAMIAYLDRLSTYEDVQVLAKRIRR